MKSFLASLVFISIVVAGAPALQARDKHVRFESHWREAEVKVDGSNADWPGPLEPFNDEPVSMAAVNDGESLFVVLTASDRVTRTRILRQGLIVWFDAGGKDKKRFGLEFPIGVGVSEEDIRGRHRGGGDVAVRIQFRLGIWFRLRLRRGPAAAAAARRLLARPANRAAEPSGDPRILEGGCPQLHGGSGARHRGEGRAGGGGAHL